MKRFVFVIISILLTITLFTGTAACNQVRTQQTGGQQTGDPQTDGIETATPGPDHTPAATTQLTDSQLTATPKVTPKPTTTPQTGSPSPTQEQDTVIEPEPEDSFAKSTADFSIKLFQKRYAKAKTTENTLVSPLSVMIALAMTANGAGGQTLIQMESALGGGMPLDMLNHRLSQFLITSENQKTESTFQYANSIWFRDGKNFFTPDPDFVKKNADYYNAAIYNAPFDSNTLQEINNWAKEATGGKISKIIEEIPDDAVLYLVNALLFEARWSSIYAIEEIQEDTFTAADGKTQSVEMMSGRERQYLSDEKAVGFVKAYRGGKYSFVALLPKEGVSLDAYVASLSGEGLRTLLANVEDADVSTKIPKFEYTEKLQLADLLSEMGMKNAFSPAVADFTNMGTMAGDVDLYIDKVLHVTSITVDALGTKAGAVSAVDMMPNSAPPSGKRYQVYLDRPFVYIIWDNDAGIPIFLGTVAKISS